MLDQQRRRRAPGEGRLAGQHLIRHDAQRVEIAAGVEVTIARGLLGRHVRRRADGHAGGREPRCLATVARGAGNAEVGHQRAPVDTVQQDVVGLDITMNDTAGVRVRQRIGHFMQCTSDVVDRQRTALLQSGGEVVAVDAGHHEKDEIADFVDRINRDNIRMAQLCGRFRLAQEARPDVAPERQLRRQQLDSHEPFEALVAGPIDDAHATATDFLVQFIGGTERLLHMGAQFSIFVGGWNYRIGHSRGIGEVTWYV